MGFGSGLGEAIAVQKIWTADELEYLKSHYGKMPTREIAAVLGRTPASVKSKANYKRIAFANPVEKQGRMFPPGVRDYLCGTDF